MAKPPFGATQIAASAWYQVGVFDSSRALRAVALALGLTWFATAADLSAETLNSSGSSEKSDQPFGLFASMVSEGQLHEKWSGVLHRLDHEMLQLAICQSNLDGCASPAAAQFLAIVNSAKARRGRARIGEINRAINLAIRPMSDFAQYGEIDVWSSPLTTFTTRAGDCEDYAIAKFIALRYAGISSDDLRIVIMRDAGEKDHAIAAVRLDGHWLTLDNRRMAMVDDVQVRNYRPIFVIDRDGAKRYQETTMSVLDARGLISEATSPSGIETSPGPVTRGHR
jgi:predicted transglutaminase-like cysteine proteinase